MSFKLNLYDLDAFIICRDFTPMNQHMYDTHSSYQKEGSPHKCRVCERGNGKMLLNGS